MKCTECNYFGIVESNNGDKVVMCSKYELTTHVPFWMNLKLLDNMECIDVKNGRENLQKWKDEYPVETNEKHFAKTIEPLMSKEFIDVKTRCTEGMPYMLCNKFTCEECKEFWNRPYKESEEK